MEKIMKLANHKVSVMNRSVIIKTSLVTLLLSSLLACGEKDVALTEEVVVLKPVRTMTVSLGSTTTKSFTGVVEANKTAELGFRVSGELEVVNTKEGDLVQKGQVLAVLDQTDFNITLNASQADFDRAASEFKRAKSLIKQGAISTADYEKLKAQQSNAKAQLESAQQNLKYTELKAPFSGVVAKQFLSNFEKISSSVTFAVIQDLSAFEVRINLPESVMIKMKRDEKARPVYAVFDGNQDSHYPLTFKEVSTRADEKTQTYAVKFVMSAPQNINLLPGMSARVFAEHQSNGAELKEVYVPAHAVLEDGQGRFVYLAIETSADKAEVVRRAVVVGELNENGLQVLQGLDVGDKVITAGMSKITQGLAVRIMVEG
jgi:RND family efflux transporter MFP subunit